MVHAARTDDETYKSSLRGSGTHLTPYVCAISTRYSSIFEAVGGGEDSICIICVITRPNQQVKKAFQRNEAKEGDLRVERRYYSDSRKPSE